MQFFTSLVESRDEHITKLAHQLEGMQSKKREQFHQLTQLRETFKKMGSQYDDLKAKQKTFSATIIESEKKVLSLSRCNKHF